jgi:hypothetical protein
MVDLSENNLQPDWFHGQWRAQSDEQIANMTPDVRRLYDEAAAVNVFGVGYQRDASGRPIETGRGSPGNMTASAKAALAKFEAERQAFRIQAGIEGEKAST